MLPCQGCAKTLTSSRRRRWTCSRRISAAHRDAESQREESPNQPELRVCRVLGSRRGRERRARGGRPKHRVLRALPLSGPQVGHPFGVGPLIYAPSAELAPSMACGLKPSASSISSSACGLANPSSTRNVAISSLTAVSSDDKLVSNEPRRVSSNHRCSSISPVPAGVPYGSVIRPLRREFGRSLLIAYLLSRAGLDNHNNLARLVARTN